MPAVQTEPTETQEPLLDASSRCDRCSARAYVQVTFPSTFELLFCSHHFKKNEDELKAIAIDIHDESHYLNK